MFVEHLEAAAQVVQPGLAIRGADDPILRALACAEVDKLTLFTVTGQLVTLVIAKLNLERRIHIGEEGFLPDIAKLIYGEDKHNQK